MKKSSRFKVPNDVVCVKQYWYIYIRKYTREIAKRMKSVKQQYEYTVEV